MRATSKIGVEAARKALPSLIDRAQQGKATLITRHGKPCALIAPPGGAGQLQAGGDIRQLRGTGKGLWGRAASRKIDSLRREWDRD